MCQEVNHGTADLDESCPLSEPQFPYKMGTAVGTSKCYRGQEQGCRPECLLTAGALSEPAPRALRGPS